MRSTVAQAVDGGGDALVRLLACQRGNQRDGLAIRDAAMLTDAGLLQAQRGVIAALPVRDEAHQVTLGPDDDLLQYSAHNALLDVMRSRRVMPKPR